MVLLAMVVVACDSAPQTADAGPVRPDAAADAGPGGDAAPGTDAGSAVDAGAVPSCFDPASVAVTCQELDDSVPLAPDAGPTAFLAPIAPVLEARTFGDDAHFVAAGEFGLLMRRGDGAQASLHAVRITPPTTFGEGLGTTVLPLSVDGSTTGFEAVDVVGLKSVDSSLGIDLAVLICKAGSCSFAGASSQDAGAEIKALPGSLLPAALTPVGMVHVEGLLCAFGDGGLACFDGSSVVQTELLPAGEAPRFREVVPGARWVAAGDEGALYEGSSATLTRLPTDTEHALIHATVDDACQGAVSLEGDWLEGCDPQPLAQCAQTPALRAFELLAGSVPQTATVVDVEGAVYERRWVHELQSMQWCGRGKLTSAGLVDVTRAVCNASSNILLMTDQALFTSLGQLYCVIV